MRILLVNKYFYRKGGAETYFFALAEGLKALGHEVAFFSMKHPNNEPSRWNTYFVSEKDYVGEISAFKKVQEASTLIYSFEAKRKFEALLEEFKPDIIHMNNVHRQLTLSILDAPYLKKRHVPVVYTAHDYILLCPAYTMVNGRGEVCDACLDRHFMHATKNVCVKGSRAKSALATMEAEFLKFHHSYDKIDLIIAPSKFMKNKLDEGGFAGKTVAMQNFLTDSQMAMGARAANTHKFEDTKAGARPYFLFFGRLSKEKGILTLVKAFLQAAGLAKGNDTVRNDDRGTRTLPDVWDLHIVGDGPERGAIEQLIASAGQQAASRIHLLGYKSGEKLQREVGNARFTVLSSEWRENMPYSGLESLAAQTPIIGARIGGIPELIEEGATGFVFASGDVDSLSWSMREASKQSENVYMEMQKKCFRYIDDNCRQNKYIKELVDFYARVL
ncbi:glycosyltransferase [Bifidobacterium dentium]|uniref:glycosyltransferase n=1 Tax=Bifidobacterium dentium TaxID=1689 RepID=UPI0018C1F446|nr:glycosyltransferase [Bifidobacterium dentium]MBF9700673.1 glycosyltransferase [Bifidobacterium dentium]